jgi:Tol biopolymer transport system component
MAGDDRLIAYTVGRDPSNSGYHYEIAVRDRQTGADRRVSVARRGGPGNRDSGCPAISPNGRFVAYWSEASNLVAGDSNRAADVFVRDLREGRTALASANSRGVPGNAGSGPPSVSSGGRVAFASGASNLVAHDTNREVDVFVRDLATGKTRRVNVDSAGRQTNDYSELPSISADGRFVTFFSFATNLAQGDTNGVPDVFVHDLKTGTTRRVSLAADGAQANDASYLYNGWNTAPAISRDGGYVAFQSSASNLVPNDTNDSLDVFVRGPLSP